MKKAEGAGWWAQLRELSSRKQPSGKPTLCGATCYQQSEHQAGREEGQKDRPSVIVLAVEREADGATAVTVLPHAQRAG